MFNSDAAYSRHSHTSSAVIDEIIAQVSMTAVDSLCDFILHIERFFCELQRNSNDGAS